MTALLRALSPYHVARLPLLAVEPHGDLSPEQPAVSVMTDFEHEHALTVSRDASIDQALQDMIRFGVRALLVHEGPQICGLITSYDIQGERPLQFLQHSNYTRHDQIQVGHIMTPWDRTPTLDWSWVRHATLGEVAELFTGSTASHWLVMQQQERDSSTIRGLLSRTRVLRHLSVD